MTIIGLDSPSVARGGRKHSAMLESLNWHHIYDFFFFCVSSICRCSGTVGAIVTCPLEVLKTRLQSSGLALRPVFQVQLGTLSGTGAGVIRPGTVTPGLLQVLR